MSDTRFTLLGIGLIFAGFIVLGIFGTQYFDATVEAGEFEECFNYFEDRPPVPVGCDEKLQAKTTFFGLVIALIGAGIGLLIKGVKGKWDQDVKPEDMVGPSGPSGSSSNSDKKD